MGILSFLRNIQSSASSNTSTSTNTGPASAEVARGRLQVLIAHDRTHRNGPEYLPHLKQDIIDVIKKYANVGEDQVMVNLDTQDNRDILELNITLPEESDVKPTAKAPPPAPEKSSFAEEAEKAAKATAAKTKNAAKNSAEKASRNAPKEAKPAKSNKKNKGNRKSRRK